MKRDDEPFNVPNFSFGQTAVIRPLPLASHEPVTNLTVEKLKDLIQGVPMIKFDEKAARDASQARDPDSHPEFYAFIHGARWQHARDIEQFRRELREACEKSGVFLDLIPVLERELFGEVI